MNSSLGSTNIPIFVICVYIYIEREKEPVINLASGHLSAFQCCCYYYILVHLWKCATICKCFPLMKWRSITFFMYNDWNHFMEFKTWNWKRIIEIKRKHEWLCFGFWEGEGGCLHEHSRNNSLYIQSSKDKKENPAAVLYGSTVYFYYFAEEMIGEHIHNGSEGVEKQRNH